MLEGGYDDSRKGEVGSLKEWRENPVAGCQRAIAKAFSK